MCAIGNGCKKLKNLTLSDCFFLSDKGLEAIATGCKELTHLEVNGCHNIGTFGLVSVGKFCKYVFLYAKLNQNVMYAWQLLGESSFGIWIKKEAT